MAGIPAQGPWYKKEDYWAIIIALTLVVVAAIFYYAGGSLKAIAVEPPSWSGDFGKVTEHFAKEFGWYLAQYAMFLIFFTIASSVMGFNVKEYVVGFTILYILSVIIQVAGANKTMKDWQLEAPLLSLAFGMLISNTMKLPEFMKGTFRTEFYVKTGIILMGATLPFTLILQAGPMAFGQATIVAVATFGSIYFAATKLFGLDPRLGAVLGAGGSICGVSGSIAIGGACRAEKEHVSVAISMVVIWAIIMIFVLPIAAKAMGMAAGPAGAWIGTSEFADAAGFAAAATLGTTEAEKDAAIKAFTLMKVVGRDMFVGVWAFLVAVLSVTVWEKKNAAEAGDRIDVKEIWYRFPKFVIGFFIASIITTIIASGMDPKTYKGLESAVISPIKKLRSWTFVFTFLSIGFTTRFRELTSFGWKPLAAFAVGVAVNVPLGYYLSNVLFQSYWMAIK